MKRMLLASAAVIFTFITAACAAAPVAAATPTPTAVITATPEPTQEPTPEPTPSPTPEPAFTQTALSETLFSSGKVSVSATGLRFSENYITYIDLTITNASAASVTLVLDGFCLNDWQVDGALQDAESIAPGETRTATAVVSFMDDPFAVYMCITHIVSFSLDLSVVSDETGKTIAKQQGITVSLPGAEPVGSPIDGATLVYEDNGLAVYLQGIDGSLQNTRVLLYKKPGAKWMRVTVDPVYAGYTNILNRTYTLDAGKYRLLTLDGTDVMTRENISKLSELNLYLSLTLYDGRLNRPVVAVITDPNVSETVLDAPEAGSIVYQSELSYFILRNMGVTEYDGHEALLLDFENITQNYIKTLDLTAYASSPNIVIDGVSYRLSTYCTNSFPGTHGYILLWPEGAPDDALSTAKSVDVRLKISRINGGHLDPIVDTGIFTIDLAN